MNYDSPQVLALKEKLKPCMAVYKRRRIHAEIRKQRMAEAKARGTHTAEEWNELLDLLDGRCSLCGCRPLPRPCKDHVKPIYMGGSDHITNLQPLCRECNSSKGSEQFDWAAHRLEHGFQEADE